MNTLQNEIDGYLNGGSVRSIQFERVITSHGAKIECLVFREDLIAFGTADNAREAFDMMKIDLVRKRLVR